MDKEYGIASGGAKENINRVNLDEKGLGTLE